MLDGKTVLREGIKMYKFSEVLSKHKRKQLSCVESAALLGMSERHFRRLKKGYELHGAEGIRDKRIGRVSPYRAADEEVEYITRLYNERYQGYSVKHFFDELSFEYCFKRSYSWTKAALIKQGVVGKSTRGGKHRLRREPKPMCGMMLHQDASTHQWVYGEYWDLVVTMDDATNEIYSMFFVNEEGTQSSMSGVIETIRKKGLFCSIYTDRGSHYAHTPVVGGKVDKNTPTQFGRALKQLGIQHTLAYSPQARGRSERMFKTLQDRLPKELASRNITTMHEANRYIEDVYLAKHNKLFTRKPKEEKSAFLPYIGPDLKDIFCIQHKRLVNNDNTVHYHGMVLQIPKDEARYHYVKAEVVVHHYYDDTYAIFYGPRCIGTYGTNGVPMQQNNSEVLMKKIAA